MVERLEVWELSDEALACRTGPHWWDNNPHVEIPDTRRFRLSAAASAWKCLRCGAEVIKYYGKDLRVEGSPYYRYPKNYRSIPGTGTRPALRAEMLSRGSLLLRVYSANGKKPVKKAAAKKR